MACREGTIWAGWVGSSNDASTTPVRRRCGRAIARAHGVPGRWLSGLSSKGRAREPRFGFMAEDEGLRGLQLWRRGWVGKQWHYEYMNPGLRNHSGSNMFADFRKDFRIPIPMFDSLVEELRVERLPWAPDEKQPKPDSPPIPLALKVMSALRVLALGVPFSAFISQGLSESVVRVFFFQFALQFLLLVVRLAGAQDDVAPQPPARG